MCVQPRQGFGGELLRFGRAGKIGRHELYPGGQAFANLGGRRLQFVLAPATNENVGAGLREGASHTLAQSLASTGNKSGPSR